MRTVITRQPVKVLTIVLLIQAAVFYGLSRGEQVPRARPLSRFTLSSSSWIPVRDQQLDSETLAVLNADDTLSRLYRNIETGRAVDLFVAWFATQRTGKAPHSPKNCLPGTGWVPSESGIIPVKIDGSDRTIEVNRYVVSRGDHESVVLYWYQGHGRTVASEYRAKLYTVFDSLRYHRSDTSLVRVVSPVIRGDAGQATNVAIAFLKTVYGPLTQYLPS